MERECNIKKLDFNDIAFSISPSSGTQERRVLSQTPESGHTSHDSDSMFGDDFPIEDLEQVLAAVDTIKTDKPEQQQKKSPSSLPVNKALSFDNNNNGDNENDDDMFGDDIPIDFLEETLLAAKQKQRKTEPLSDQTNVKGGNLNSQKEEARAEINNNKQDNKKPSVQKPRYTRYIVASTTIERYMDTNQKTLLEKVYEFWIF